MSEKFNNNYATIVHNKSTDVYSVWHDGVVYSDERSREMAIVTANWLKDSPVIYHWWTSGND